MEEDGAPPPAAAQGRQPLPTSAAASAEEKDATSSGGGVAAKPHLLLRPPAASSSGSSAAASPSSSSSPTTPLLGGRRGGGRRRRRREQAAAGASSPSAAAGGGAARGPFSFLCPADPERRRRLWFGLGLGQVLSLLIAATGVFSSRLAADDASRPTTQSALTYVLLSLYLTRRRGGRRAPLRVPWWRYGLLAVVDVEANFFVVLAYRYTAITSVMLLDCFAIPCAMALSRLVLRSRYRPLHFVGVGLCLLGLVGTVLSDRLLAPEDQRAAYPYALLGDGLCLVGAGLYAASNVMQEALVKAHDRDELLGMLGAYGAALSFMQAFILEWVGPNWRHEAKADPAAAGHWGRDLLDTMGFAGTLALMYSLTAWFLTEADATLFNLSLLTSDIYAVLYRYLVLRERVTWLYGVAFGCTFLGLCAYNAPPPVNRPVPPPATSAMRGSHGYSAGRGEEEEEEEEAGSNGLVVLHPEVCLSRSRDEYDGDSEEEERALGLFGGGGDAGGSGGGSGV